MAPKRRMTEADKIIRSQLRVLANVSQFAHEVGESVVCLVTFPMLRILTPDDWAELGQHLDTNLNLQINHQI